MPADPARTYAGAAFPSPADNDLRGRLAMTMIINFFLVPTRGPHPIPSPVASRPSIPLCHLSPPLQRTTKHLRSERACVQVYTLQSANPVCPWVRRASSGAWALQRIPIPIPPTQQLSWRAGKRWTPTPTPGNGERGADAGYLRPCRDALSPPNAQCTFQSRIQNPAYHIRNP